ncbi:hypothetical protein [Pseudarthrobacter sp. MM222]|uniref:hypothetical protein n=1 Tax=Pseudarthrobacter sp. MM222 TaxID=3018929 RepID=UPI002221164D|nr:hypothetical protein [Pseudarthrobacter sp. MM222]CAI3799474.1 hypothetical protein NKCBBBOE_02335 [Pseudarthrobacter sp. MM222]
MDDAGVAHSDTLRREIDKTQNGPVREAGNYVSYELSIPMSVSDYPWSRCARTCYKQLRQGFHSLSAKSTFGELRYVISGFDYGSDWKNECVPGLGDEVLELLDQRSAILVFARNV